MRRTLIELLHLSAGVIGTLVFAAAAAWALPHAFATIWEVATASIAAVLLMGIRPLRTAWRADRADRARGG